MPEENKAEAHVDNLLSSIFKETDKMRAYRESKERECVPPEYADKFTAINIESGAGFFREIMLLAACNKCGALIYPTALDRHAAYHEDIIEWYRETHRNGDEAQCR